MTNDECETRNAQGHAPPFVIRHSVIRHSFGHSSFVIRHWASPVIRHSARRLRRRAFSYIELCVAIVILGVCIIPGAQALRTVLDGQQSVETRYGLGLVAQSKIEDAMRALQTALAARSDQGDLASLGHADWYYDTLVTVSGDKTYATVRVRVWADKNSNQVADADEPLVRFDTIVASRF